MRGARDSSAVAELLIVDIAQGVAFVGDPSGNVAVCVMNRDGITVDIDHLVLRGRLNARVPRIPARD